MGSSKNNENNNNNYQEEEEEEEEIIPGISDDVALRCLAKVSHGYHGLLESVSKRWRDALRSSHFSNLRSHLRSSGNWLFVLTEHSNNVWIAYDPDSDIWHPLPAIPYHPPDDDDGQQQHRKERHHIGFSCVCVSNKFLVIGGSYAFTSSEQQQHSPPAHKRPLVTSDVFQFDPFTKQWSRGASMRTPRSHFACCVVAGKVYVAGGRNSSFTRVLSLAEAYDPVTDTWDELPPMPSPLMDCIGLSYKGKVHVLNDQVGLSEMHSFQVFDPLTKLWCTVEDKWPFSRSMQFGVQVMGDGQVYIVVDWGESFIKTRDSEGGEWYNVGSVPSVILPDHKRPLEAFSYGFAALRNKLYVIGGKVLKWEEAGNGRFDIVRLGLVRVCNAGTRPLKWKETRPMCGSACGSILGCASLEEESPL